MNLLVQSNREPAEVQVRQQPDLFAAQFQHGALLIGQNDCASARAHRKSCTRCTVNACDIRWPIDVSHTAPQHRLRAAKHKTVVQAAGGQPIGPALEFESAATSRSADDPSSLVDLCSVTYPLSAWLLVDDAATAMSATSAVRSADVIFIETFSPRSFRAGAATTCGQILPHRLGREDVRCRADTGKGCCSLWAIYVEHADYWRHSSKLKPCGDQPEYNHQRQGEQQHCPHGQCHPENETRGGPGLVSPMPPLSARCCRVDIAAMQSLLLARFFSLSVR